MIKQDEEEKLNEILTKLSRDSYKLGMKKATDCIREVVLNHCDGTFPGSTLSMPEMNSEEVENFIRELQEIGMS